MTVRFLHYYTLEDIEKLCRLAESKGEKIRVSIEMFGKEKVVYIQRDLSKLVQEEEVKTYGFSYGMPVTDYDIISNQFTWVTKSGFIL